MDITLKNIPIGISEEQIKEWVAMFVEQHQTNMINQIPEVVAATKSAQVNIDGFRKANSLKPRFEQEVAPKEVIEEPIKETDVI